jgi:hypothetical protein
MYAEKLKRRRRMGYGLAGLGLAAGAGAAYTYGPDLYRQLTGYNETSVPKGFAAPQEPSLWRNFKEAIPFMGSDDPNVKKEPGVFESLLNMHEPIRDAGKTINRNINPLWMMNRSPDYTPKESSMQQKISGLRASRLVRDLTKA